ncbi:MAG: RNA-dependent DNA polymerase [Hangzhou frankliniella intonsa flavivirus 1]|nr:MAG: RNA-dependent DNA polymerase [Hangzhou frankliniella intonsa flavivirus 1]
MNQIFKETTVDVRTTLNALTPFQLARFNAASAERQASMFNRWCPTTEVFIRDKMWQHLKSRASSKRVARAAATIAKDEERNVSHPLKKITTCTANGAIFSAFDVCQRFAAMNRVAFRKALQVFHDGMSHDDQPSAVIAGAFQYACKHFKVSASYKRCVNGLRVVLEHARSMDDGFEIADRDVAPDGAIDRCAPGSGPAAEADQATAPPRRQYVAPKWPAPAKVVRAEDDHLDGEIFNDVDVYADAADLMAFGEMFEIFDVTIAADDDARLTSDPTLDDRYICLRADCARLRDLRNGCPRCASLDRAVRNIRLRTPVAARLAEIESIVKTQRIAAERIADLRASIANHVNVLTPRSTKVRIISPEVFSTLTNTQAPTTTRPTRIHGPMYGRQPARNRRPVNVRAKPEPCHSESQPPQPRGDENRVRVHELKGFVGDMRVSMHGPADCRFAVTRIHGVTYMANHSRTSEGFTGVVKENYASVNNRVAFDTVASGQSVLKRLGAGGYVKVDGRWYEISETSPIYNIDGGDLYEAFRFRYGIPNVVYSGSPIINYAGEFVGVVTESLDAEVFITPHVSQFECAHLTSACANRQHNSTVIAEVGHTIVKMAVSMAKQLAVDVGNDVCFYDVTGKFKEATQLIINSKRVLYSNGAYAVLSGTLQKSVLSPAAKQVLAEMDGVRCDKGDLFISRYTSSAPTLSLPEIDACAIGAASISAHAEMARSLAIKLDKRVYVYSFVDLNRAFICWCDGIRYSQLGNSVFSVSKSVQQHVPLDDVPNLYQLNLPCRDSFGYYIEAPTVAEQLSRSTVRGYYDCDNLVSAHKVGVVDIEFRPIHLLRCGLFAQPLVYNPDVNGDSIFVVRDRRVFSIAASHLLKHKRFYPHERYPDIAVSDRELRNQPLFKEPVDNVIVGDHVLPVCDTQICCRVNYRVCHAYTFSSELRLPSGAVIMDADQTNIMCGLVTIGIQVGNLYRYAIAGGAIECTCYGACKLPQAELIFDSTDSSSESSEDDARCVAATDFLSVGNSHLQHRCGPTCGSVVMASTHSQHPYNNAIALHEHYEVDMQTPFQLRGRNVVIPSFRRRGYSVYDKYATITGRSILAGARGLKVAYAGEQFAVVGSHRCRNTRAFPHYVYPDVAVSNRTYANARIFATPDAEVFVNGDCYHVVDEMVKSRVGTAVVSMRVFKTKLIFACGTPIFVDESCRELAGFISEGYEDENGVISYAIQGSAIMGDCADTNWVNSHFNVLAGLTILSLLSTLGGVSAGVTSTTCSSVTGNDIDSYRRECSVFQYQVENETRSIAIQTDDGIVAGLEAYIAGMQNEIALLENTLKNSTVITHRRLTRHQVAMLEIMRNSIDIQALYEFVKPFIINSLSPNSVVRGFRTALNSASHAMKQLGNATTTVNELIEKHTDLSTRYNALANKIRGSTKQIEQLSLRVRQIVDSLDTQSDGVSVYDTSVTDLENAVETLTNDVDALTRAVGKLEVPPTSPPACVTSRRVDCNSTTPFAIESKKVQVSCSEDNAIHTVAFQQCNNIVDCEGKYIEQVSTFSLSHATGTISVEVYSTGMPMRKLPFRQCQLCAITNLPVHFGRLVSEACTLPERRCGRTIVACRSIIDRFAVGGVVDQVDDLAMRFTYRWRPTITVATAFVLVWAIASYTNSNLIAGSILVLFLLHYSGAQVCRSDAIAIKADLQFSTDEVSTYIKDGLVYNGSCIVAGNTTLHVTGITGVGTYVKRGLVALDWTHSDTRKYGCPGGMSVSVCGDNSTSSMLNAIHIRKCTHSWNRMWTGTECGADGQLYFSTDIVFYINQTGVLYERNAAADVFNLAIDVYQHGIRSTYVYTADSDDHSSGLDVQTFEISSTKLPTFLVRVPVKNGTLTHVTYLPELPAPACIIKDNRAAFENPDCPVRNFVQSGTTISYDVMEPIAHAWLATDSFSQVEVGLAERSTTVSNDQKTISYRVSAPAAHLRVVASDPVSTTRSVYCTVANARVSRVAQGVLGALAPVNVTISLAASPDGCVVGVQLKWCTNNGGNVVAVDKGSVSLMLLCGVMVDNDVVFITKRGKISVPVAGLARNFNLGLNLAMSAISEEPRVANVVGAVSNYVATVGAWFPRFLGFSFSSMLRTVAIVLLLLASFNFMMSGARLTAAFFAVLAAVAAFPLVSADEAMGFTHVAESDAEYFYWLDFASIPAVLVTFALTLSAHHIFVIVLWHAYGETAMMAVAAKVRSVATCASELQEVVAVKYRTALEVSDLVITIVISAGLYYSCGLLTVLAVLVVKETNKLQLITSLIFCGIEFAPTPTYWFLSYKIANKWWKPSTTLNKVKTTAIYDARRDRMPADPKVYSECVTLIEDHGGRARLTDVLQADDGTIGVNKEYCVNGRRMFYYSKFDTYMLFAKHTVDISDTTVALVDIEDLLILSVDHGLHGLTHGLKYVLEKTLISRKKGVWTKGDSGRLIVEGLTWYMHRGVEVGTAQGVSVLYGSNIIEHNGANAREALLGHLKTIKRRDVDVVRVGSLLVKKEAIEKNFRIVDGATISTPAAEMAKAIKIQRAAEHGFLTNHVKAAYMQAHPNRKQAAVIENGRVNVTKSVRTNISDEVARAFLSKHASVLAAGKYPATPEGVRQYAVDQCLKNQRFAHDVFVSASSVRGRSSTRDTSTERPSRSSSVPVRGERSRSSTRAPTPRSGRELLRQVRALVKKVEKVKVVEQSAFEDEEEEVSLEMCLLEIESCTMETLPVYLSLVYHGYDKHTVLGSLFELIIQRPSHDKDDAEQKRLCDLVAKDIEETFEVGYDELREFFASDHKDKIPKGVKFTCEGISEATEDTRSVSSEASTPVDEAARINTAVAARFSSYITSRSPSSIQPVAVYRVDTSIGRGKISCDLSLPTNHFATEPRSTWLVEIRSGWGYITNQYLISCHHCTRGCDIELILPKSSTNWMTTSQIVEYGSVKVAPSISLDLTKGDLCIYNLTGSDASFNFAPVRAGEVCYMINPRLKKWVTLMCIQSNDKLGNAGITNNFRAVDVTTKVYPIDVVPNLMNWSGLPIFNSDANVVGTYGTLRTHRMSDKTYAIITATSNAQLAGERDVLTEDEQDVVINFLAAETKRTSEGMEHERFRVHAPTGWGKSTKFPLGVALWAVKQNVKTDIYLCEPRRTACVLIFERLKEMVTNSNNPAFTKISVALRMGATYDEEADDANNREIGFNGDNIVRIVVCTYGKFLYDNQHGGGELRRSGAVILLDEVHCRDDAQVIQVESLLYNDDVPFIALTATLFNHWFYRDYALQEDCTPKYNIVDVKLLRLKDKEERTSDYHYISDGHCWYKAPAEVFRAGQVLVFLPTKNSCDEARNQYVKYYPSRTAASFYSGKELDLAVDVIFSTDVAEASVTFPSLVVVVDFRTNNRPDVRISLEERSFHYGFVVSEISSEQATQRRGRVGRVAEGYYVYRECALAKMEPYPISTCYDAAIESSGLKLKYNSKKFDSPVCANFIKAVTDMTAGNLWHGLSNKESKEFDVRYFDNKLLTSRFSKLPRVLHVCCHSIPSSLHSKIWRSGQIPQLHHNEVLFRPLSIQQMGDWSNLVLQDPFTSQTGIVGNKMCEIEDLLKDRENIDEAHEKIKSMETVLHTSSIWTGVLASALVGSFGSFVAYQVYDYAMKAKDIRVYYKLSSTHDNVLKSYTYMDRYALEARPRDGTIVGIAKRICTAAKRVVVSVLKKAGQNRLAETFDTTTHTAVQWADWLTMFIDQIVELARTNPEYLGIAGGASAGLSILGFGWETLRKHFRPSTLFVVATIAGYFAKSIVTDGMFVMSTGVGCFLYGIRYWLGHSSYKDDDSNMLEYFGAICIGGLSNYFINSVQHGVLSNPVVSITNNTVAATNGGVTWQQWIAGGCPGASGIQIALAAVQYMRNHRIMSVSEQLTLASSVAIRLIQGDWKNPVDLVVCTLIIALYTAMEWLRSTKIYLNYTRDKDVKANPALETVGQSAAHQSSHDRRELDNLDRIFNAIAIIVGTAIDIPNAIITCVSIVVRTAFPEADGGIELSLDEIANAYLFGLCQHPILNMVSLFFTVVKGVPGVMQTVLNPIGIQVHTEDGVFGKAATIFLDIKNRVISCLNVKSAINYLGRGACAFGRGIIRLWRAIVAGIYDMLVKLGGAVADGFTSSLYNRMPEWLAVRVFPTRAPKIVIDDGVTWDGVNSASVWRHIGICGIGSYVKSLFSEPTRYGQLADFVRARKVDDIRNLRFFDTLQLQSTGICSVTKAIGGLKVSNIHGFVTHDHGAAFNLLVARLLEEVHGLGRDVLHFDLDGGCVGHSYTLRFFSCENALFGVCSPTSNKAEIIIVRFPPKGTFAATEVLVGGLDPDDVRRILRRKKSFCFGSNDDTLTGVMGQLRRNIATVAKVNSRYAGRPQHIRYRETRWGEVLSYCVKEAYCLTTTQSSVILKLVLNPNPLDIITVYSPHRVWRHLVNALSIKTVRKGLAVGNCVSSYNVDYRAFGMSPVTTEYSTIETMRRSTMLHTFDKTDLHYDKDMAGDPFLLFLARVNTSTMDDTAFASWLCLMTGFRTYVDLRNGEASMFKSHHGQVSDHINIIVSNGTYQIGSVDYLVTKRGNVKLLVTIPESKYQPTMLLQHVGDCHIDYIQDEPFFARLFTHNKRTETIGDYLQLDLTVVDVEVTCHPPVCDKCEKTNEYVSVDCIIGERTSRYSTHICLNGCYQYQATGITSVTLMGLNSDVDARIMMNTYNSAEATEYLARMYCSDNGRVKFVYLTEFGYHLLKNFATYLAREGWRLIAKGGREVAACVGNLKPDDGALYGVFENIAEAKLYPLSTMPLVTQEQVLVAAREVVLYHTHKTHKDFKSMAVGISYEVANVLKQKSEFYDFAIKHLDDRDLAFGIGILASVDTARFLECRNASRAVRKMKEYAEKTLVKDNTSEQNMLGYQQYLDLLRKTDDAAVAISIDTIAKDAIGDIEDKVAQLSVNAQTRVGKTFDKIFGRTAITSDPLDKTIKAAFPDVYKEYTNKGRYTANIDVNVAPVSLCRLYDWLLQKGSHMQLVEYLELRGVNIENVLGGKAVVSPDDVANYSNSHHIRKRPQYSPYSAEECLFDERLPILAGAYAGRHFNIYYVDASPFRVSFTDHRQASLFCQKYHNKVLPLSNHLGNGSASDVSTMLSYATDVNNMYIAGSYEQIGKGNVMRIFISRALEFTRELAKIQKVLREMEWEIHPEALDEIFKKEDANITTHTSGNLIEQGCDAVMAWLFPKPKRVIYRYDYGDRLVSELRTWSQQPRDGANPSSLFDPALYHRDEENDFSVPANSALDALKLQCMVADAHGESDDTPLRNIGGRLVHFYDVTRRVIDFTGANRVDNTFMASAYYRQIEGLSELERASLPNTSERLLPGKPIIPIGRGESLPSFDPVSSSQFENLITRELSYVDAEKSIGTKKAWEAFKRQGRLYLPKGPTKIEFETGTAKVQSRGVFKASCMDRDLFIFGRATQIFDLTCGQGGFVDYALMMKGFGSNLKRIVCSTLWLDGYSKPNVVALAERANKVGVDFRTLDTENMLHRGDIRSLETYSEYEAASGVGDCESGVDDRLRPDLIIFDAGEANSNLKTESCYNITERKMANCTSARDFVFDGIEPCTTVVKALRKYFQLLREGGNAIVKMMGYTNHTVDIINALVNHSGDDDDGVFTSVVPYKCPTTSLISREWYLICLKYRRTGSTKFDLSEFRKKRIDAEWIVAAARSETYVGIKRAFRDGRRVWNGLLAAHHQLKTEDNMDNSMDLEFFGSGVTNVLYRRKIGSNNFVTQLRYKYCCFPSWTGSFVMPDPRNANSLALRAKISRQKEDNFGCLPFFELGGEVFEARLTPRLKKFKEVVAADGKFIDPPTGLFKKVVEIGKLRGVVRDANEKHHANAIIGSAMHKVFGLTYINSAVGHTNATADKKAASYQKRLDIQPVEPIESDRNKLLEAAFACMTPAWHKIRNGPDSAKFKPWTFDEALRYVHNQGKGGKFDRYLNLKEACADAKFREEVEGIIATWAAGGVTNRYETYRVKNETKAKKIAGGGKLEIVPELDPNTHEYKRLNRRKMTVGLKKLYDEYRLAKAGAEMEVSIVRSKYSDTIIPADAISIRFWSLNGHYRQGVVPGTFNLATVDVNGRKMISHCHVCDSCKCVYQHRHTGQPRPHRQFEGQCPYEKCEWYHRGENASGSVLMMEPLSPGSMFWSTDVKNQGTLNVIVAKHAGHFMEYEQLESYLTECKRNIASRKAGGLSFRSLYIDDPTEYSYKDSTKVIDVIKAVFGADPARKKIVSRYSIVLCSGKSQTMKEQAAKIRGSGHEEKVFVFDPEHFVDPDFQRYVAKVGGKDERREIRLQILKEASRIMPRGIQFAQMAERVADLMVLGPIQTHHNDIEKHYTGSTTGTPLWKLGNVMKAIDDMFCNRREREFAGAAHWRDDAFVYTYANEHINGMQQCSAHDYKRRVLCGDFSGFDGTVTLTDHAIGYLIDKEVYQQRYHKMLKTRYEHVMWSIVITDDGNIIMRQAQRGSGDQNTSRGNTLINTYTHICAEAEAMGISIAEAAKPIGEVWYNGKFGYEPLSEEEGKSIIGDILEKRDGSPISHASEKLLISRGFKRLYLTRITNIGDGDDNVHFGHRDDLHLLNTKGVSFIERIGKALRCGTQSGYEVVDKFERISFCSHGYERTRIGLDRGVAGLDEPQPICKRPIDARTYNVKHNLLMGVPEREVLEMALSIINGGDKDGPAKRTALKRLFGFVLDRGNASPTLECGPDWLNVQHLVDSSLGLRVQYLPTRPLPEIIGKLTFTMKANTSEIDMDRSYGSCAASERYARKNEERIALTRGKILAYLLNYAHILPVRQICFTLLAVIGDGVCDMVELRRRFNVPGILKSWKSAVGSVFNVEDVDEIETLGAKYDRAGLALMAYNTRMQYEDLTTTRGKVCPPTVESLAGKLFEWLAEVDGQKSKVDWKTASMADDAVFNRKRSAASTKSDGFFAITSIAQNDADLAESIQQSDVHRDQGRAKQAATARRMLTSLLAIGVVCRLPRCEYLPGTDIVLVTDTVGTGLRELDSKLKFDGALRSSFRTKLLGCNVGDILSDGFVTHNDYDTNVTVVSLIISRPYRRGLLTIQGRDDPISNVDLVSRIHAATAHMTKIRRQACEGLRDQGISAEIVADCRVPSSLALVSRRGYLDRYRVEDVYQQVTDETRQRGFYMARIRAALKRCVGGDVSKLVAESAPADDAESCIYRTIYYPTLHLRVPVNHVFLRF